MSVRVPRRAVTGHDASGRGVVLSDGPAAVLRQVADGASFYELWATASSPAPIEAIEPEPVAQSDPVGPPPQVLDDETTVGPGDLVVQRGTDHAWENRSSEPVRMLFVLLDGRFGDALLQTLPAGVRSRLMHDVP